MIEVLTMIVLSCQTQGTDLYSQQRQRTCIENKIECVKKEKLTESNKVEVAIKCLPKN